MIFRVRGDRRIEAIARRSSVGADVTEALKSMIADGTFGPGERLPSQRELSGSLKVSLPTVREAVRSLTDLGLLEARHGSGTYVTSLDAVELLRPLEFALSLSGQQMMELFEVRLALEPSAARLAAKRRSDEQLSGMRENLALQRNKSLSHKRRLELDLQMHQQIVEAAGNELLGHLMRAISSLGLASRRRTVALPGVQPDTPDDHERIVDAIAAHDEDLAEEMMRTHIERIRALAIEAGLPASTDAEK